MQRSVPAELPEPVPSRRRPSPPSTPSSGGVAVDRSESWVTISGAWYSLSFPPDGGAINRTPYAVLVGADGHNWTDLSLLASVDTVESRDETHGLSAADVVQRPDGGVTVTVTARSSSWQLRETRFDCTESGIAVSVRVVGSGRLDDVVLLGGMGSLPSGATGEFRSSIGFRSLFAPVPTEPVAFVRPSRAAAVLGVNGDADPGRLNGIFSPPPLVFGFGRGEAGGATGLGGAGWLALSIREAVDSLTCTGVRYEPIDGGFRLRLPYEGHTRVEGEWISPSLVLAPADRALDVIDAHRDDLVAHGLAPAGAPTQQDWWTEPMFCGWGAQCARSMRHLHGLDRSESEPALALPADLSGEPEPHGDEEELVVLLAPQYARQDVYDEFLAELAAAELDPGTIVVDDRWQHEYGTAEPDTSHWPDLRRWIADRHAEGRKVLLWWKAWDPEGLPLEECVTDPFGRTVAVDPGSDAYLARLRRIIERLLGAHGLDADGFKVDFTQRTPSGRSLRHSGSTWGIAALHRLLAAIHSAAHAVKPDALVITHAIHPSFGDVGDMVRLNDVLERDVRDVPVPVADQLRMRHAIARRALPGHTVDTDQWPMPDRAEWLSYVEAQAELGVPALYYLEAMDRSPEAIGGDDLRRVAGSWQRYRERRAAASAELR